MTELDQLKAIKELDGPQLVGLMKRGLWYRPKACGYTNCECEAGRFTLEEAKEREYVHGDFDDVRIVEFSPKPYTTSWDAIIPVIQKQSLEAIHEIGSVMKFFPEPLELCERLLRATDKWK